MEKNQIIEGTAIGLGTNGEGIVKQDGVTLFVPYLLTGERARIKVLKIQGAVGYGKVEEVYTPAEERVRPVCPVFTRCGGCQLQHIAYRTQLKFKSKLVHDALKKIAGIELEIPACVRSESAFGYRNKLQLPVGRVNGENVIGFYAERSHRIVPVTGCPIHPDWAGKLIEALRKFMDACGQDGYDEETERGIRHLVVRDLGGKFIVTLVTTEPEIKGIDYFLHLLDGIFAEYSLLINVNMGRGNAVFGDKFIPIKGTGKYECTESGISFEAGANTFVQVNGDVRRKLYAEAVSLVGEGKTVIDCYAGGGLLTALFAKKCKRAYGIEIVPEAHECAERLKERNGLSDRMTNLCGGVEELLPKLLEKEKNATIVLDPPRAGIDKDTLQAIKTSGVEKIILISCNPATLARDVGVLTGSLVYRGTELLKAAITGEEASSDVYEIKHIEPFDMFPQTKHVETIVCLERKRSEE